MPRRLRLVLAALAASALLLAAPAAAGGLPPPPELPPAVPYGCAHTPPSLAAAGVCLVDANGDGVPDGASQAGAAIVGLVVVWASAGFRDSDGDGWADHVDAYPANVMVLVLYPCPGALFCAELVCIQCTRVQVRDTNGSDVPDEVTVDAEGWVAGRYQVATHL